MSADTWELPEELRQIQDTVARFMAAEVKRPKTARRTMPSRLDDVLAGLQAKARAIGLWCVRSPVEHGGAG
ncbi:MAG: acyl-CoA dehydrogenase family protein [Rubrivivax sp.]